MTIREYLDARGPSTYARHLESREPVEYRGMVVP
jgi:hypothetical protein